MSIEGAKEYRSDVSLADKGIGLRITKSKTDQAREGVIVAMPEGNRIRSKALLLAWMAAAGHADKFLFRRLTPGDKLTQDEMSDRAIARLVQRCAALAGYEPAHCAGHSLRAGILTEAAANRASIFKMQDVSRHRSVQLLSEQCWRVPHAVSVGRVKKPASARPR